jgi:pilus assembly protein Flp/PilA
MKFANSLMADRTGATAIEYGLIAALVAVAGISAFASLGGSTSNTYSITANAMANANNTANG